MNMLIHTILILLIASCCYTVFSIEIETEIELVQIVKIL